MKEKADNVGKDLFMKLLEEGLKTERIEHQKTTRELSESRGYLTDANSELRHMTLMAKMYKELADLSKDGDYQEDR